MSLILRRLSVQRFLLLVVILAFLFSSAPAVAGEAYRFTYERRGGLLENVKKGRVLAEGSAYRLELEADDDPRRAYDVLISEGEGAPETGLVLAEHTYHEPDVDLSQPSSPLFWLVPVKYGARRAKKVDFEVPAPTAEELAGLAVQRHEIRLSYRASIDVGERVTGNIRMTAVFWMHQGKTLPLPRLLRPEIRTGFPEIDSRLTEELSRLHGVPLKQQVSIHSEVENGIAQNDTVTIEISGLGTAKTTPDLFAIPQGFKLEEPVYIGPGLASPVFP